MDKLALNITKIIQYLKSKKVAFKIEYSSGDDNLKVRVYDASMRMYSLALDYDNASKTLSSDTAWLVIKQELDDCI